MQLKEALKAKGIKVVDLYEQINRKYLVDYQTLTRYCRCSDRSTNNPLIWSWIDETIKSMGVNW